MILTPEHSAKRRSKQAILDALVAAGATITKPTSIRCPFHDDKTASSGVYEEDGIWRFKCHGCNFGGDVFDVIAHDGKSLGEQFADSPGEPKTSKRVYKSLPELQRSVPNLAATFTYANPETLRVEMVVFRIELNGKKTFWQACQRADGYVMEAPPKPWPLYNRARVAKSNEIIVVEGEKCVHALHGVGYVATTSPGGAGKARYADWRPLAGKTVYLWPDCDPVNEKGIRTGIEHMREVARVCQSLDPQPTLLWIDPDQLGLPPKGDVVDYLREWKGTPEENHIAIKAALETATRIGAAGELNQLIEDTLAGKRLNIPWPWPEMTRLARALMPGTVTCLCGDAGATKSYLLLQAAVYWHQQKHSCAIYELEEDRAYHLNRLLAQLADNADLLDPDWMRAHPEETRAALNEHRSLIDEFGKSMYAAPDEQLSLDEIAGWVLQMSSAGKRMIVVDPITAALQTDKPWIDDLKFLMRVKTIVRQHGSSLVLATHPRKGKRTTSTLHDLAGGAAYQRFSQTVLWIQRLDAPKNVLVNRPCGTGYMPTNVTINRTIAMHKTRNGRGAGLEIGFDFSGRNLMFGEQGVILDGEG